MGVGEYAPPSILSGGGLTSTHYYIYATSVVDRVPWRSVRQQETPHTVAAVGGVFVCDDMYEE
jgi:hypothetical protein